MGTSDPSVAARADTNTPGAPTGVTNAADPAPPTGNTLSITVNWTDATLTLGTGFTIQWARDSAFTNSLAQATVDKSKTTYTITGLRRDTRCWVCVRSQNTVSIYSVWVNATPLGLRTAN